MLTLTSLLFCVMYMNNARRNKEIDKELIPLAWHPSRWWGWCMP